VRVRLWGTRGSVASPGPDTVRYGGNTACVEVRTDGALIVLDAGTGIRPLGAQLRDYSGRIDLLLSHLHLDHIQGLGFFEPCFRPDVELHIWGPASTTADLGERLSRYLSPPLFPVRLRDLGSHVLLHDMRHEPFTVGDAVVRGVPVIHPGPTVGYRIEDASGSMAYLPDHEPALGAPAFPLAPAWTSGHDLAAGVDVLLHDSQYTTAEYPARVGWGHSSTEQAWAFAAQAEVGRLVTFHHDPSHDDQELDALVAQLQGRDGLDVIAGTEGLELTVQAR
jgi:phosphoribosyl 1,2-cyclic phosphodiesterase